MAEIQCHRCRKERPGDAGVCPHCGEAAKACKAAKPKRWYERTSVTLCVAAALSVIAIGFIHIITGVEPQHALPFDIARKVSFGYSETFVDAARIKSLPFTVAKTKYPIGCRVLQDKGYMSSGRDFEARATVASWDDIRRWDRRFDEMLGRAEPPWRQQLRDSAEPGQGDLAQARDYNRRGIALARADQYAEAIAEFTRAIRKAPAQTEAYHNRALVHIAIGNLGQAVADFEKIVEIEPGFVEGHLRRGRLHMAMNQYDEAIADFSRVVEIDAQCAEAYFKRALARYGRGQYDQAWDDVNKLPGLEASVPSGFLVALQRASGR